MQIESQKQEARIAWHQKKAFWWAAGISFIAIIVTLAVCAYIERDKWDAQDNDSF